MKRYSGDRTIDGIDVRVDGKPLPDQQQVASYTDQGFEWSYDGPEPQQLALALLVDHFGGDGQRATQLSKPFMKQVIAKLDNTWEMTSSDITDALTAIGS